MATLNDPSYFEIAESIADALLSDNISVFNVGGVAFGITSQSREYNRDAAINTSVTIMNLANSDTVRDLLSKSEKEYVQVNVMNSPRAQSFALINWGYVNINADQVRATYVSDKGQVNFTLQHIVNHEIVHVLTGLPDGPVHLNLVNRVNQETLAGPARLTYGGTIYTTDGSFLVSDDAFGGQYSIQPGDTVSEIARDHNTTVDAIMAANPQISNRDLIYAGDTINLPGPGSTSGSSSGSRSGSSSGSSGSYTVQRGDTASEIARDNNTTVDALMDANPHIDDPDEINAGDTLNMPGDSDSGSASYGGSDPVSGPGSKDSFGNDWGTGDYGTGIMGDPTDKSTWGDPILLDLDGDGVEITPLHSSNMYFDMSGDGLENRTAWAGAGDGVLVRDAGDDGIIDQANEVNFTLWDATARSDMEALR
jgi:LysM repeat protein